MESEIRKTFVFNYDKVRGIGFYFIKNNKSADLRLDIGRFLKVLMCNIL